METFIGIIFGLLIFTIVLGVYLLPTLLAFKYNHRNKIAIVAVNLLLGWTFFGWIGAFVWSLTKDK